MCTDMGLNVLPVNCMPFIFDLYIHVALGEVSEGCDVHTRLFVCGYRDVETLRAFSTLPDSEHSTNTKRNVISPHACKLLQDQLHNASIFRPLILRGKECD